MEVNESGIKSDYYVKEDESELSPAKLAFVAKVKATAKSKWGKLRYYKTTANSKKWKKLRYYVVNNTDNNRQERRAATHKPHKTSPQAKANKKRLNRIHDIFRKATRKAQRS